MLDRILNRRVDKDFFEYAALLKTKSDVSDKEIFEAARQANAYDFIENLPGKWNSQVGEGPFLKSIGLEFQAQTNFVEKRQI